MLSMLYASPEQKRSSRGIEDFNSTLKQIEASATVPLMIKMDPQDPTVYNNLITAYYNFGRTSALIPLLIKQLPDYGSDSTTVANIHFYTGELYLGSNNKLAKEYFLKSRVIFRKIFPPGNQVFEAIDEGLKDAGK